MIASKVFKCCGNSSKSLITYSVAGEQKTYSVCNLCENLDYFKKYVIQKIPIPSKSSEVERS